jgi:uncharacterized repeat protein (TIGR03803 family)
MSCTPIRLVSTHFLSSVLVFLLAGALASPAQTFTSLVSLGGTDGGNPYYMYLVQGTDGNLYGTMSTQGANNAGTVFRMTTVGKLTPIYPFCSLASCADGVGPHGGLVLATNGNFYGTAGGGGANSVGTVYEITSAGKLTTLHSFDYTDGSTPYVGLVQATNGNFYGTTSDGGNGYGTIFEITPTGTLTSLHTFDGTDGQYPDARLVQGTNGILYGTTYATTAFEITLAGKLTNLPNFAAWGGSGPTGAFIQATNGNFYGTTSSGGANGQGTVFDMTPAGKVTLLYSFCSLPSCADGQVPWAGLIQGTDGNFYGTTSSGGANGQGTIFQLTPKGILTTLYNFCSLTACADGSSPYEGLVQATNGTFYGTTYSGGTNSAGTIFSLSMGLGPFVQTVTTSGKVAAKFIILGTNLAGATAVSFNGTAATFTVVKSSEITATVPAGATTGTIKVTTPGGILSSNVAFRVTPQLTSFTPPSGPVGQVVTITGVSLTKTTKVTIAGVVAAFTVVSDTELTVTVPTGAVTGKIVVTTSGGTASSATSFTVT